MGGPYRTKDVEQLLGLGEHVFRYWERELPLLSPTRTLFRHREWTSSDIALLWRVRHLVRSKLLNLDATLDKLIAERSGETAEAAAVLSEVRSSLIAIYFESKAMSNKIEQMLNSKETLINAIEH